MPQIAIAAPTHVDVMVTRRGRLRWAPLLLATLRDLAPGVAIERRYEGIQIVTIMLSGHLITECDGHVAVLGPEDVAVRTAGSGIELRTCAPEPARALELWLPSRADIAPRVAIQKRKRAERLGALWPIAGRSTDLALEHDVAIAAGVLALGTTVRHRVARRSYLISTIGRIAIDGAIAEPGARVLLDGVGGAEIEAIESTEVVTVAI